MWQMGSKLFKIKYAKFCGNPKLFLCGYGWISNQAYEDPIQTIHLRATQTSPNPLECGANQVKDALVDQVNM